MQLFLMRFVKKKRAKRINPDGDGCYGKNTSSGGNTENRTFSLVVALVLVSVAASLVAHIFLLVTTFLICQHAERKRVN